MKQQQEITTILFARYNRETKALDYEFTNSIYYVNNTDVIVDPEFKVTISLDSLNQEEFTRLALKTLRDKQAAAWAQAQQTVADLEEKIKELQLLTWQSDVLKEGEFQVKDELIYNIPEPEVIDAIQQTELDIAEGEWEAYPEDAEKEYTIVFTNYSHEELPVTVIATSQHAAYTAAKAVLPKNFSCRGYAFQDSTGEKYPEEVITYGEPAIGTVQSMSFEEADNIIVVDSISTNSEEFLKLAETMRVIPLSNGKCVPVSEDDYKDA